MLSRLETSCKTSRFIGLDITIWLPVALLSWVELQQVGAAVVVASVVAAVGHRNLHRGVVRSGGQMVRRSGGQEVRRSGGQEVRSSRDQQ